MTTNGQDLRLDLIDDDDFGFFRHFAPLCLQQLCARWSQIVTSSCDCWPGSAHQWLEVMEPMHQGKKIRTGGKNRTQGFAGRAFS
jgi:hypothetical protein